MNDKNTIYGQEVSIQQLVAAVIKAKWIIAIFAFVGGAISIAVALNLPNFYRSDVLLSPIQDSQTSGLDGQFGGLASLAGINLAQGNERSKLALEILKSKQFAKKFIDKHNILPELMAVKSWDRESNKFIYNEDKYSSASGEWFRKGNEFLGPQPTISEIHEAFISMISFDEVGDAGLIKISFTHYSPYIAKTWLELIVLDINSWLKNRDIAEAERSIKFLKQQIQQAKVAEIKNMLFNLIEEQMKTVMLAETRDEYVFKVIDPAIVADVKFKPKRSLIVVLGVFVGMFLAIMAIIIRRLFRNEKYI